MKRFGYLGNPNDNSEALFSEHAVVYGLMKLQAFAGLPQTGKIDQDTLNVSGAFPVMNSCNLSVISASEHSSMWKP